MDNLKNGYVTITTKEYKELILKEKDLEDTNSFYNVSLKREKDLEEKIVKLEEEIKELLLLLVPSSTTNYNGKFQSFEITSDVKIAEYINKNYVIDKQLQYRKIEKEKE